MKSKFNKLFVTILLVVAVTCCGAFGVLAADNTDEAAFAISSLTFVRTVGILSPSSFASSAFDVTEWFNM